MRGHIVDEPNIQKKRVHLDTLIKQKATYLTWKQRKAHVDGLMVDPDLFEKLKKSLLKVVENHGISCFSIEPRSILMWSHYGQHHKGIALQFEYAKDVINFQFTLPIEYRKDYPTIEYYGDPSRHKEFILRKYEDWSYEKEWRLVRHENANAYHPFNSAALTGVILGCRIDPHEEDRIRAMIVERDKLGLCRIRLYKARLHAFKYRLVICKA